MKTSNYSLAIQLMPNDELMREQESIGDLLPHLYIMYPHYKNKMVRVMAEMQKRGLAPIN